MGAHNPPVGMLLMQLARFNHALGPLWCHPSRMETVAVADLEFDERGLKSKRCKLVTMPILIDHTPFD